MRGRSSHAHLASAIVLGLALVATATPAAAQDDPDGVPFHAAFYPGSSPLPTPDGSEVAP